MPGKIAENQPNFYGSVTVGERGQVVIPVEARRYFDIVPGGKLLVFNALGGKALMLLKAEAVSEYIANATNRISRLEEALKTSPTAPPGEEPALHD